MKNKSVIRITVFDFKNDVLEKASVSVLSKATQGKLKYDPMTSSYILDAFTPGDYIINVASNGFESQERKVFINQSGYEDIFILGEKNMPSYYRGIVKVPFKEIPGKFGMAIQEDNPKKIRTALERVVKKYGIEIEKNNENFEKNGLFIFSFSNLMKEEEHAAILEKLKKETKALAVGPVVQLSDKNASILTDEIIVRFEDHIDSKTAAGIAKRLSLKTIRTIPYAGNAYQYRVTKGTLYKTLDACNQLIEMKVVKYAEPNMFHTFEDDAIVPNNYLYPEQWDHPIINTPDAWQVLNDSLGVAQRFGSPDVVVAVVDSGVDPNHPQFNGNVSNGQPKVFTAFDFVNMVANNNSLAGSHGTCCASAAAGFTNVNSGTAGVPDGTVGIAGNCRVMGIRRGGTELDYADMYIWIGGFNPNSVRVGFPAQLARGADIITNSFGYSIGSPISGLMRDTFDHLTIYGRGGKGLVLTFSVGNYASNINFHLSRPWAAYQKTFACGASSYANDGTTEIISAYSGSGTLLDFCAPSHDAYVGGSSLHNPPTNYAPWTGTILSSPTSDGNAPRNRQLQTTMNAAAVAGNTTINVASTAGMAINQAIIIGNPSPNISTSEAKRITNIVGNTITFTPALFANKANGTVVNYGNRDYRNNFGGTSYSTPVIAGVSALMLSVNNRLTWIEVREILRGTATKIDPNNANAVGRWTDINGLNSGQAGYLGPFFSQFYGYGRINAAAAVQDALDYTHTRDIFVRDNMADDGSTTTTPPHWQGADIWVNNAGLVPANYATHANTVHEPPTFGQANLLHVRYKNRGTATSFPFYVRAYLVHFPGTEFIYPDNFIPSVRPNGVIPNPLTPGTYLIGEQLINPLAAGAEGYVTFNWPANLVPPQTVLVGGVNVNWHPCLLAEVSPHDGFVPTGNNVWDNNNLAQKNISIIYPDNNSDNAAMVILGNTFRNKLRNLKFKIFSEPAYRVPYFICFTNKEVNEVFIHKIAPNIKGAKPGRLKKLSGVWIHDQQSISFDLPDVGLSPIIIGLGRQKNFKETVELNILQYSGNKVIGSAGIEFRAKK